jgi:hypothetical protein
MPNLYWFQTYIATSAVDPLRGKIRAPFCLLHSLQINPQKRSTLIHKQEHNYREKNKYHFNVFQVSNYSYLSDMNCLRMNIFMAQIYSSKSLDCTTL